MNRATLERAIDLNNRIISISSTITDLRNSSRDLVLFDRSTRSTICELDDDTLAVIIDALVNKENTLKQEFASL